MPDFQEFRKVRNSQSTATTIFLQETCPSSSNPESQPLPSRTKPAPKEEPKVDMVFARGGERAHFADAGNGGAERRASKQHHGRSVVGGRWALRCTSSSMPQKVFELGRRRRRRERLSVDYDRRHRPKISSKTGVQSFPPLVSCVQYFYYVRCFSVCELLRCTRFPNICITLSESPPRPSLHSACYAALKYSTRAILPSP